MAEEKLSWTQRWVLPFVTTGLVALKIVITNNPAAIATYKKACDTILEIAEIIKANQGEV